MAAILQSKGRIITHKVVLYNWRFLKLLTAKQFANAAHELEALHLGQVYASSYLGATGSTVFIKAPPEEVQEYLSLNEELCAPEFYIKKYNLPISSTVPSYIVQMLATDGVISQEMADMHKK